VADIDAVMEEFALDSFFTGDFDSELSAPVSVAAPGIVLQPSTSNKIADSEDEMTLETITAGLLAALVVPRNVSEKDEKRKSQR
jgi:hypothetical protein